MRYYKDKYNLPVWNWLMLQRKGFDVKYLLKNVKNINNKSYKKLQNVFESILYSLDNTDNNILYNYILWKSLLVTLKAELLRNSKPRLHNLEQTFRDYIESLMKIYENFEVKEYYFNPDHKKIFENLFRDKMENKYFQMILENFKYFENIKFYTWDEYTVFVNQYPEMLALTLHDNFKEAFILSRTIKINDLVELDTHLSDIYVENNMYNLYQFIRLEIFDINVLKSESKNNSDPFKELASISNILGFQIDAKKTSLAEYEGHIETVKRKVEESKPKADRHGNV